jgi:hypothetical protein
MRTAKTQRNLPDRVAPRGRQNPAAIASSTAFAPTNTSCSTKIQRISSYSCTTTWTVSSPSAPPKKTSCSASPTPNGASTAPSPWKPAFTATVSIMYTPRKLSATDSTTSINGPPRRMATPCRPLPLLPWRATSSRRPSMSMPKATTPLPNSPATKPLSSAP